MTDFFQEKNNDIAGTLALKQGVGMVTDFRLDKSSWQAGIAAIS